MLRWAKIIILYCIDFFQWIFYIYYYYVTVYAKIGHIIMIARFTSFALLWNV